MSSRLRQRWRTGGTRTQANEAIQNTVNNFTQNLVQAPGRLARAVENRIQGVSQQLNNVPAAQQNESVRPIGSAGPNGTVWAGQSYGYQSRASFNALKDRGHFRAGDIALRRVGNDIVQGVDPTIRQAASNAASQAAGQAARLYDKAPQPVKQVLNAAGQGLQAVDAGLESVSRATNTSRLITDELAVAALTAGAGKAIQGVKQLNTQGRIASRIQTRQASGAGVGNRIQRRLSAADANRAQLERGAIESWGEIPRRNTPPPRRIDLSNADLPNQRKVVKPKVEVDDVLDTPKAKPNKPKFPNANNRTFPRGRQSATLPGKDPIGTKEAERLINNELGYYGRIVGDAIFNTLEDSIRIGDFRKMEPWQRAQFLRAQEDMKKRLIMKNEGNILSAAEEANEQGKYLYGRLINEAIQPEAPITWHGRKYKVVDGQRVYIDEVDAPQRIKQRLQRRSPVTNTEVRKRNELQKAGKLPESLDKNKSKDKLKELNQRFADLIDTTDADRPLQRRPVKGSRNRPIANSRFDDDTWRYKDQNEAIIEGNRRIRNRLRTKDYEQYFEEKYPRSNYPADMPDWEVQVKRTEDFRRDHPDIRLNKPTARLKTDNPPGKNSVRNVFREGQERRGQGASRIRDRVEQQSERFTGDGVYRDRGKADPQWEALSKNPNRRPRSPQEFVEAPKNTKSRRINPRRFKAQRTVDTDRTVPIGLPLNRGAVDRPIRPKSKPDRIRRRIHSTGTRDAQRMEWMNRWRSEAKKDNTFTRRTGRLKAAVEATKKRKEQARRMRNRG